MNIAEEQFVIEADPQLLQWIVDKCEQFSVQVDLQKSELKNTISMFLMNDTIQFLFISVDKDKQITCTTKIHELYSVRKLCYFLKEAGKDVTASNVDSVVMYGVIDGNPLDHLLNLIKNRFAQTLLSNESSWPESIKKDFSSHLHKFLASLTETTYRVKGSTVLYVPDENITNVAEARKQKDLVQRLEFALMHWTSQIKEVVHEKDSVEHIENARPLSEIEYWRARTKDLINIKKQIQRPEVKQILDVLAKSSYLQGFQKLYGEIQQGCIEAQENLKFLSTLQEPCEKLAKAEPKDIPKIIPEILEMISMIWQLSTYYNTSERISSLLRKVSNEIIYRCCQKISLQEIFHGDVFASMKSLEESIHAGVSWKNICTKTFDKLQKYFSQEGKKFEYDKSSVFPEVAAFVQRCKELVEVCEAQIQFGGKGIEETENPDGLPVFGGTKGPEITKNLLAIRSNFNKLIHDLSTLDYPILDVKSTKWHDDYGKFKNGIKDLELIMQNVISSAFETVTTVESGVELLEAFSYLAKRDAIKRSVELKTGEICNNFTKFLENIMKNFEANKRNPPLQPYHPKLFGSAIWAYNYLEKIKSDKEILDRAHFLPRTRERDEMERVYSQVAGTLEKYIAGIYNKWREGIDSSNVDSMFDRPLMIRNGRFIETNFDIELLKIFEEVRYWEKLPNYEIPYEAMDIATKEEKLRIARENVSLLVRDYNDIIKSLNEEEHKLFRERLRDLDVQINPGFVQITWSSKGMIDYFVVECRKHCKNVKQIITEFKEKVSYIYQNCKVLSDTLLISIQPKKVYSMTEFEKEQEQHREKAKEQLKTAYNNILSTMQYLYTFFSHHSAEIRAEWRRFVKKIEERMDMALRQTVKKSQQKLANTINPKAENTGSPLFLVQVVLAMQEHEMRPSLRPPIEDLYNTVDLIGSKLTQVVEVVPGLQMRLLEEETKDQEDADTPVRIPKEEMPECINFYDSIKNDKEIINLLAYTMDGMRKIDEDVKKYLYQWESEFKMIWNIDKDSFIRRFAIPANRPVATFEAEIKKYSDKQAKIQNEEASVVIGYLQLDCAPLKHTLVMECNAWQNKILVLLHSIASKELNRIYAMFDENTKLLVQVPTNQEMLAKKIALLEKLEKEEQQREKVGFGALFEQFQLLNHFEVTLKEDEIEKINKLTEASLQFKETIMQAKKDLEIQMEKFRIKLRNDLDAFNKSIANLAKEFAAKMPTSSNYTVQQANEIIRSYKAKLKKKRAERDQIASGLKIFGTEMQQYKEFKEIQKYLDNLQNIWSLKKEWETTWNRWRNLPFEKLDISVLEQGSKRFITAINKLGREIRDWGVWTNLKEQLAQFKRTLPLIQDLKNPALRDRHWYEIADLVGDKFDHTSDDFTFEKIIELGFENYANDISGLSHSATQELTIENDLNKIKELWENLNLKMELYREKYHVLGSTEEIFLTLDDNIVTLVSIKISPHVVAFQESVTHWEKTLSRIAETIETILAVQKQWKHFLNIFEVETMQKQLPEETANFRLVNAKWASIMTKMYEEKNVLRATHQEGLLDILNELRDRLEEIQKQLDDYLEVKRQEFSRFYFLSDSDLLEILGQQRDPRSVQKHLRNCFAGITELTIITTKDKKKEDQFQAIAMKNKEEEMKFLSPVLLKGPVEKWLQKVEESMRAAVKKNLIKCYAEVCRITSREKWIDDWQGQLLITASQLFWTKKVGEALDKVKTSKRNPIKDLRKMWNGFLKKYSEQVRGQLTELTRKKLTALLTIEVHARDVIDKLLKNNVSSSDDFEWKKQLTFHWDEKNDTFYASQTSARIDYDYEYIGNQGRLVVTDLTDRCYMTLTTAIQLCRGGNPQGPAGTGKTETVKDLGKNVAKLVIVFNCSDGLDQHSMGRMFSGLAQTGAWSCFDEFNRIEIEVLSVVAQQIMQILTAVAAQMESFVFLGKEIKLNPTVGIFVTMNPGYAGRTELPDNLKALLRPISMMVPDSSVIAEIVLFSQGFDSPKHLSRKIATLYALMEQQLSKQTHYDFGLRNIISVLVTAGRIKRENPEKDEELLLLQSCRDMNLPKFVSQDIPLFTAILGDLFPGVELPEADTGDLQRAIETDLQENGLQVNKYIVQKCIQLQETKQTRHGVMVVGNTCSGKTTCWKTLKNALTRMHKQGIEGYYPVHEYVINPKALTCDELFGNYYMSEWRNGVVAAVMKDVCSDTRPDLKWIVFDGPVDTLWIESMNSVLDDNKVLTLISSERINLTPQVSLLFEVEDLSVASPATVSRCGMVFFDDKYLGWEPFVETWVQKRLEHEKSINTPDAENVMSQFKATLKQFIAQALQTRQECKELIETSTTASVRSLCNLFDAIANPAYGLDPRDSDYPDFMKKILIFAMIWSIGATVDEESRNKMDMLFREFDPQFPNKDTVYEYYVDPKTRSWRPWDEKVNPNWKPLENVPYYNILVPTIDTVRNSFVLNALISAKKNTLVIGNIGTGKTVTIKHVLGQLDEKKYVTTTINFSASTSSKKLQQIIETKVDKKSFDTYAPPSGKQLVIFIDDFNMPAKDQYFSQPPLELLRQWIDYGFLYDRNKQFKKNIRQIQLVCAMGPPGGGRNTISNRLKSRFNIINITFPSDSQQKRIFGTLLKHRLEHLEDLKKLSDVLTQATIDIYKLVTTNMLPKPNTSHYVFNLRDLSKVFEGMIQGDHESMDSADQLKKLWVHECYRVFHDRLNNEKDRMWFKEIISEKLSAAMDTKWKNLYGDAPQPTIFGRLLTPDSYQEITDMKKLKDALDYAVTDFNETPGNTPMQLVMFHDAIQHLSRIHRILKQPRGNALLIGVGGSGRSSLTRLAAHMCEYDVFQIEITSNYTLKDFHANLKELYFNTGIYERKQVFLFSDTQIVEKSFMEDINNILSSGEVPNLFNDDDLKQICDGVRKAATEEGIPDDAEEFYNFFLKRARNNLHVVVCMSPVGDDFRKRLRLYPALVNCTTIDWYSEWPQYALKEVAQTFLEDEDLGGDNIKDAIAETFVQMHTSVVEQSAKMLAEIKRTNYVTPTNYLELVSGYKEILKEKRKQYGEAAEKLEKGLHKLESARKEVEEMQVVLVEQKKNAAKSKKECEDLMVIILQERQIANDKKHQVEMDRAAIAKEKEKSAIIEREAQAELDQAMPALREAENALSKLDPKEIFEIRNYKKVPEKVQLVVSGVMVALRKKTDWNTAKQVLGPKLVNTLLEYKKDEIPDSVLNKLSKYVKKPGFDPEEVKVESAAAMGMCKWVIAIEQYGRIAQKVKPKKIRLANAKEALEKNKRKLEEAEAQLREVEEKVERLGQRYKEMLAEKEKYRKLADETEAKLKRAEQLVNGLADERERWTQSIKEYKTIIHNLVGDVLLAAGFLSYCGPFTGIYREELLQNWWKQINMKKIPVTYGLSIKDFLASKNDIRQWIIEKLPTDNFSIENGILVERGRRWPLLIDPQGQGNTWLKNHLKNKQLQITDFKKKDFLRTIENGVKFGLPVLIQDITEEIDPSLDPILGKKTTKKGNREIIKIGDREIDYNNNFRLYLTTKLANPHYPPEISTKTTIVNFSVTQEGLEDQLLGIVVQQERKELEENKNAIVVSVTEARKRMAEIEDEILQLLQESEGSLLDDENLIKTLQISKATSESIKKQLTESVETEKKINAAREQYRKAANRASILYFALTDLGRIDPMYQFSLAAYITLFQTSIEKSEKPLRPELVQKRVEMLNDYHTYEVYRTTCQGLFERHKLLFSFQMCIKILQNNNEINLDEYYFFLRGGQVLDKDSQTPNPCPEWLSETSWDNIFELDKLPNFHGLAASFEDSSEDWKKWFMSPNPESEQLPSEWQTKIGNDDWAKMLIVRCIRPDRVIFYVKHFITEKLGAKFIVPPVTTIRDIFKGSTAVTPFIFVLSPGVDPRPQLEQFAAERQIQLHSLALGRGQEEIAEKLIAEASEKGHWVFLANCHLMISWMPKLAKIVMDICTENPPHKRFRLWLSSKPHEKFPIFLLQQSRKITTEPPQGLKSNMLRLYNTIKSTKANEASQKPKIYTKLLFALSFFHSILQERSKFGTLGLNIPYDFNDSDFSISQNILSLYIDSYEEIPWAALKYLISDVSYGGRVTDDMDRRVLDVYINQFFVPEAVEQESFALSSDTRYSIPAESTDVNSVIKMIGELPDDDPPEAFGQHPNADISSQISASKELLDTLLDLSPKVSSKGKEETPESRVYATASDLQENRIPQPIDSSFAEKQDESALNTVLLQEISRYNVLLEKIHEDLTNLKKGINGEVVMNAELEEIFNYILDGRVPPQWQFAYPSLKPLASWVRDLIKRVEQLNKWAQEEEPIVFWLSGFTYPSGFLTALKQTTSRSQGIPIDELTFEFNVIGETPHQRPKEGAYVSGIYLEGAGWDEEKGCLCEPEPMKLVCEMPIIHFKPQRIGKKSANNVYSCPLYIYPNRAGANGRPSFITSVELKTEVGPEHWIKRGTALLLSTST